MTTAGDSGVALATAGTLAAERLTAAQWIEGKSSGDIRCGGNACAGMGLGVGCRSAVGTVRGAVAIEGCEGGFAI